MFRSSYIIVGTLMLLLASCVEEEVAVELVPTDVVSQEKFTEILMDIQILEGAFQKKAIVLQKDKKDAGGYYVGLFKKHEITREEFEYSFAYYRRDPTTLQEIYDEVMTELSKKQAELMKNSK